MNLLDNLSGWFADLQPRERLIIAIGAVLVIVAAIYMSLLPAMQKNVELEQRHKTLSADIQWLREQSELVSSLNSNCSGKAFQSDDKKEVITRIVRRTQLKLLALKQEDSPLYSLTVSGNSSNRVLQLIHKLTCQGLSLETLEVISSAEAKVGYIANIEVTNVD